MKQRTIFMSMLCAIMCALSTPVTVRAVGEEIAMQTTEKVLIFEVSPESKQAASQEFVNLYNAGSQPVDVSGWQLQYRSASHLPADEKGWNVKALLGCNTTTLSPCSDPKPVVLAAGEVLHLTTNESSAAEDQPLASGMATTGGQVRLVSFGQDGVQKIQDFVGYGTAQAFEGSAPAVAPRAGQSIVRAEVNDAPQDTDDNAKDFILTPAAEDVPIEAPSAGGPGSNEGAYLAPSITEVFPDPASPQTDSNDEFIELYNPFDEAIDLDGYAIVTGANWSRSYSIQDVTLGPGEYAVLLSSATNISLSNSGTGVRLLDPAGVFLFEVPSYGKAVTGSSWVQEVGGHWVWTSQPTPGAPNVVVEPPAKASVVSTSKKASSTSKPKAGAVAKSSTKKAASGITKNAAKVPGEGAGTSPRADHMNYMILAIAAAAAGGYILFEYRRDIAAYFRAAWQRARVVFRR